MAPTFHIFRHVEGAHEVSGEDMQDPDLSDPGRQRCGELRNMLPWMDKVTHLVSSPMQRALSSCLLTFEPVISRGKRTVALLELTDAGTREASFGSSKSERLEYRATVVRVLLQGHAAALLSDAHVVVMTHGLLAHFLAEEFEAPKFGAVATGGPPEHRSFQFAPEPKDDVRLVERDLGELPTEEPPYNLDPDRR
ncbi:hypothetical protein DL770_005279 [Monosporascus sp. CRB-9-2]|nr:hypothetical protein DL770_005279 [Monosporascus sp. CRB-9-2]